MIYKYNGVKNRPIFEIADVLEEYQRIETEIREGTVTVDDDKSEIPTMISTKSLSPLSSIRRS